MPTTTIETPVVDPRFRRRVAKELSFWWRRRGAQLNHVLTRFPTTTVDSVYSGPYLLSNEAFAIVHCVVSVERGPEFKRDYARQLRTTLAPEVPPDRVFVMFQPIEPADYLYQESP